MGPLLPLIMMAAPKLAQVFGGAAKGSSDQRMAENHQSLLQSQMGNRDTIDRAALSNSNANARAVEQNRDNQFRADLDLRRKEFTQDEPSVRAKQALTGSLMNRIQPMRAPQGFTQQPSILDAIGPEAREAGSLLSQRGLEGLKNPTQFDAMPDVSLPDILQLPPQQLAQLKGSGMLEKILGSAGLISSTVGALGDLSSVDPYGKPRKGYDEPSDEEGFG